MEQIYIARKPESSFLTKPETLEVDYYFHQESSPYSTANRLYIASDSVLTIEWPDEKRTPTKIIFNGKEYLPTITE